MLVGSSLKAYVAFAVAEGCWSPETKATTQDSASTIYAHRQGPAISGDIKQAVCCAVSIYHIQCMHAYWHRGLIPCES